MVFVHQDQKLTHNRVHHLDIHHKIWLVNIIHKYKSFTMSSSSDAIFTMFDPMTDTGNQGFDIGLIELHQKIEVCLGG